MNFIYRMTRTHTLKTMILVVIVVLVAVDVATATTAVAVVVVNRCSYKLFSFNSDQLSSWPLLFFIFHFTASQVSLLPTHSEFIYKFIGKFNKQHKSIFKVTQFIIPSINFSLDSLSMGRK